MQTTTGMRTLDNRNIIYLYISLRILPSALDYTVCEIMETFQTREPNK